MTKTVPAPPDVPEPGPGWQVTVLVAAPVVALAARLISTPWYQDGDDTLDAERVLLEVAASAVLDDVGAALTMVSGLLYAAAAAVLALRVRARVPRTASAGLVLGVIGGFGLVAFADQQLTVGQASRLGEHSAAMERLFTGVYDSQQAGLTYGLLVLGAVGWVLLGTALHRTRAVPGAAAILTGLGGAAVMVTAPGPARPFLVTAAALSLIGLSWTATATCGRRPIVPNRVAAVGSTPPA